MPKRQINSIDSSATINNELTFDQTIGLSVRIDEKVYNFNGNNALMKFLNSAATKGNDNKNISNLHYTLDSEHNEVVNNVTKEREDGVSWAN